MSLVEHLIELRDRLIRSAWGILLGTVASYSISEKIFDFIRKPIEKYLPSGGLVFTAPMDKFVAHLKIAFFGGVILSSPFWLLQIWKFIAPALYAKEKKYASLFLAFGLGLFLLGICFCYFVVFPMAFEFLMNFGGSTDKPMITIDQYFSFVVTTALLFGLSFELPLILVVLSLIGIISGEFLKTNRRYAIVLLAIVAAILTPPDLISMLSMLIPMVLLYELAVLLVTILEKRSLKASATTSASDN